jgi:pericentriolar material 1 protein
VCREQDGASGFSLFEALREAIYAEVATLISQNEARPHFLIELFRSLQLLSTDFLRQRALIAINDLLRHYLTDAKDEASAFATLVSYVLLASLKLVQLIYLFKVLSPVNCGMWWLALVVLFLLLLLLRCLFQNQGTSRDDRRYDYIVGNDVGSSISTPTSDSHASPFAEDSLGTTVIHFEKVHQSFCFAG